MLCDSPHQVPPLLLPCVHLLARLVGFSLSTSVEWLLAFCSTACFFFWPRTFGSYVTTRREQGAAGRLSSGAAAYPPPSPNCHTLLSPPLLPLCSQQSHLRERNLAGAYQFLLFLFPGFGNFPSCLAKFPSFSPQRVGQSGPGLESRPGLERPDTFPTDFPGLIEPLKKGKNARRNLPHFSAFSSYLLLPDRAFFSPSPISLITQSPLFTTPFTPHHAMKIFQKSQALGLGPSLRSWQFRNISPGITITTDPVRETLTKNA